MFLFNRSKRKLSSRQQIRIKEVRDGVLILPDGQYRSVLETSSINFELKSSEEQDVLIDNFQHFLNALPCSLQILIRIREIDIDTYLDDISIHQDQETEETYKQLMSHYREFVQQLVSGNKILSRKFYIVITLDTASHANDFDTAKEQLLLNQDIVSKALEKLGMNVRTLDSFQILDLFYSFYNPDQHKIQPLRKQTLSAVLNNAHAF